MNNRKVINISHCNSYLHFLCWLKESLRQASKKELVHFFEREQTSPKVTEAKERALCGGGKKSFPSRRPAGGTTQSASLCIVLSPQPCYGRRIFSFTPHVAFTSLQPTGTPSDIYYYHTNHLGSTAYVTDQNQTVTQGFLYAPFGEITTEFNATFGSDIIPKYSFNAKELDEETGMYYYEARYYKPPVFTSRDPMFEKKPWFSPYVYCKNNPIIMIDPNGRDEYEFDKKGNHVRTIENKEADIIRVVNRKGKEIAVSDPFAYGTVQEVESDGSKPNKTTLSINNNANRISIFEFLAENTNVEWMTISAKKDNVEKNYVATSKLRDEVSDELAYKLKIEDYTATAYAHSHPKSFFGNNYPSGYGYLRDKEGYGDFDSFITLKQLWHDIDVRVFDANNGHYYLLGRTKDDVIDIDRQGNRKKLNPYQ